MTSTKRQDATQGLPEPMALTPEQLMDVAATTAGGLLLVSSSIIRCGGFPPFPTYGSPAASVATLAI